MDMHAGQLSISPETVRELVDDQFPQWRSLAVQAVDAAGTVNAIFRIGGQLAARFALIPGNVLVCGGAWPGSSTSAAWDQRTLPWILLLPGICSSLAPGRCSATTCGVTIWSGTR